MAQRGTGNGRETNGPMGMGNTGTELLLLLLLTDEHITIRNKQGAIDLRTTGFLK